MKIKNHLLKLRTNHELEFIDVTSDLENFVESGGFNNGFVTVFSRHTTLAIKINEDEPLLKKDYLWLMDHIAPGGKEDYFHDMIHLREDVPHDEPKNAKGHLRCLLLETSQKIPVVEGKLFLGRYQRVFAIETCSARDREVLFQFMGE